MLPTILIHGYKYDPAGTPRQDPRRMLYKHWRDEIPGETIPFSWFSVPVTPKNIFRTWMNGHVAPFFWAWELTHGATNRLCSVVQQTGDCNIFCHSLGARVALGAAARQLPQIKNVLILNGAETRSVARVIVEGAPWTEFWNFPSPTDDALSWLKAVRWDKNFIGRSGGGEDTPPNWHEEFLPCSEHSHSHIAPEHWKRYRTILKA